jgi:predicted nucleic acid-binding protein
VTIEQQVLEKFRELPPEKQKEVLDFVDSLKGKDAPKAPRRSLSGTVGGSEHQHHGRRHRRGIIAATALHLGLPLVTRDRRLQAAGLQTIW